MITLLKSMLLTACMTGLMAGAVHAKEEAKEAKQPTKPAATAPASGASTAGASSSASTASSKTAMQVDINSASEKELANLSKIGEVKSKAIVKNRPYRGKDELVGKKILTQKEYDDIKDQIIAKQSPAPGDKKK